MFYWLFSNSRQYVADGITVPLCVQKCNSPSLVEFVCAVVSSCLLSMFYKLAATSAGDSHSFSLQWWSCWPDTSSPDLRLVCACVIYHSLTMFVVIMSYSVHARDYLCYVVLVLRYAVQLLNPLTPASNCLQPTPNFLAFFGIFQSERKHKINHMRSNHRHKIRFQDIVYLKSNKGTAKISKNINRKNSTWCV